MKFFEFFSDIYNRLASLSQKLPQIEHRYFFIIIVATLVGLAIIVALTLLGSHCRKLKLACLRVVKYLADKDTIDDDNVGDLTTNCFSSKAPQSMRDAWVQYLGVRYGFPSEIISEQNVFDKEVKRHRDIRANVYLFISLILLGLFAFWGFGTLEAYKMGLLHCAGLIICVVCYFIILLIGRCQYKRALSTFNTMQEDLDAKVNLNVERNYAVDSSPLTDVTVILDEIIARNTSKYIEAEEAEEEPAAEEQPETPVEEQPEETEEQTPEEETPEETEEQPEEEPSEEQAEEQSEEELEEEPVEEEQPEEEPEEEQSEEEESEETEELVEEEPAQEEEEQLEESVQEEPEEETPEETEEQSEEEEEQPSEEAAEAADEEPEEEPSEEEEAPKESKLVKLPSLIDYMLSMNLSRGVKINFAMTLLGQYNKRKDNPEDKAIIIECLKKIIADLTKQQQQA